MPKVQNNHPTSTANLENKWIEIWGELVLPDVERFSNGHKTITKKVNWKRVAKEVEQFSDILHDFAERYKTIRGEAGITIPEHKFNKKMLTAIKYAVSLVIFPSTEEIINTLSNGNIGDLKIACQINKRGRRTEKDMIKLKKTFFGHIKNKYISKSEEKTKTQNEIIKIVEEKFINEFYNQEAKQNPNLTQKDIEKKYNDIFSGICAFCSVGGGLLSDSEIASIKKGENKEFHELIGEQLISICKKEVDNVLIVSYDLSSEAYKNTAKREALEEMGKKLAEQIKNIHIINKYIPTILNGAFFNAEITDELLKYENELNKLGVNVIKEKKINQYGKEYTDVYFENIAQIINENIGYAQIENFDELNNADENEEARGMVPVSLKTLLHRSYLTSRSIDDLKNYHLKHIKEFVQDGFVGAIRNPNFMEALSVVLKGLSIKIKEKGKDGIKEFFKNQE